MSDVSNLASPTRPGTLPGSETREDGRTWRRLLPLLGYAALLVAAAYLLSPALSAVHVEGFTAQIQASAIAADAGYPGGGEALLPLQAEYLYLTRMGVVFLLQILARVLGTNGDITFHLLTVASFALFIWATVAIGRRYSQGSILALLAALLITPGISELPLYFNDNVVSVAWGMLGIAIMPPGDDTAVVRSRMLWALRAVLAGVAMAWAILARLDGVFMLPLLAGLTWLETRQWRTLFLLGFLVCTGMILMFAGSYLVSDSTVWDSLQVGRYFDSIHSGYRRKSTLAAALILFFGVANALVLPVGAVQNLRESSLKRKLILFVLPLLLLAFTITSATETRQIYPLLAPFIAIHGGRGLQWLYAAVTGRNRARAGFAGLCIAGILLAWAAPPAFIAVKDGPRALFGRLWSPPQWFKWQDLVEQTMDDIGGLIDKADQAPRITVITGHHNTNHYLGLRLWQRGYRPLLPHEAVPGCDGGFLAWRKDGHELVHVRSENPYWIVKDPAEYLESLQLQRAFKCQAVFKDTPVYMSDYSPHLSSSEVFERLRKMMPGLEPEEVSFGWPEDVSAQISNWLKSQSLSGAAPQTYGLNRSMLMSPEQVVELSAMVDQKLASYRLDRFGGYLSNYDKFLAVHDYKFWRPREQRSSP